MPPSTDPPPAHCASSRWTTSRWRATASAWRWRARLGARSWRSARTAPARGGGHRARGAGPGVPGRADAGDGRLRRDRAHRGRSGCRPSSSSPRSRSTRCAPSRCTRWTTCSSRSATTAFGRRWGTRGAASTPSADGELGRRLHALLRDVHGGRASRRGASAVTRAGVAPYATWLTVSAQNRTQFVRVDEVDWLEADGKYVRLHAGGARAPHPRLAGGGGGAAGPGALRPHPPVDGGERGAHPRGAAVDGRRPPGHPARRHAAAGEPHLSRRPAAPGPVSAAVGGAARGWGGAAWLAVFALLDLLRAAGVRPRVHRRADARGPRRERGERADRQPAVVVPVGAAHARGGVGVPAPAPGPHAAAAAGAGAPASPGVVVSSLHLVVEGHVFFATHGHRVLPSVTVQIRGLFLNYLLLDLLTYTSIVGGVLHAGLLSPLSRRGAGGGGAAHARRAAGGADGGGAAERAADGAEPALPVQRAERRLGAGAARGQRRGGGDDRPAGRAAARGAARRHAARDSPARGAGLPGALPGDRAHPLSRPPVGGRATCSRGWSARWCPR